MQSAARICEPVTIKLKLLVSSARARARALQLLQLRETRMIRTNILLMAIRVYILLRLYFVVFYILYDYHVIISIIVRNEFRDQQSRVSRSQA